MKSKLVEKIIQTGAREERSFLEQKGMIYSFLNPVSYLDALEHQELFCQMDGLFADGSLLVAAIRMCYGVKVERRSFDMTSIAPVLLDDAAKSRKSVYIVGSRQEQVEKAVATLCDKFRGINIIGYRNGYFMNDEEKEKEAQHIVELNPDLLIVGMGTVRQEKFLLKVKEAGFQGLGFTCGGFIHQASKNLLDYYPAWMDRMNLRHLYRMYKEPHTRMRYLRAGFIFPPRFVWERFFGNMTGDRYEVNPNYDRGQVPVIILRTG